jgi:hydroxymethylglutaryl-CoA lyase
MMLSGKRKIFIQDVAPRDGLQIEPRFIETDIKVELIDALSETGLAKIEVSSFVSPKAVPKLSDAAEVFKRISRNPSVRYVALAPNMRGARAAVEAEADEINLVMSASETHNAANMGMTCEQSLQGFKNIAAEIRNTRIHGTVATAFGCPFEGEQKPDRIIRFIERYLKLGFAGVTLADTTGMANPRQVFDLVSRVTLEFPGLELTLHFHNTRGAGLANVLAALHAGANRFDASLGGIGGCPFAPGATGNICTEDLVHMLDGMGLETGVDLPALLAASRQLPAILGHDTPGQVVKAGRSCDLHAIPESVQNKIKTIGSEQHGTIGAAVSRA